MEPLFKRFYQWLNECSQPVLLRAVPLWISPNGVTYFRVIMVIPIFLLLYFDYKLLAITAYVVNSLLDYVDGALARSRNCESDWGKFLDPMADKIYYALLALLITFIVFSTNDPDINIGAQLLVVVLSISEETLIAAIRIDDYHHNKMQSGIKRELKADYSGKIKFNLQLWGLGFLMLAYPVAQGGAFWMGIALIALSLPFAFLSFYHKNNRH